MTTGWKVSIALIICLLGANLIATIYVGFELNIAQARQGEAAEQLAILGQQAAQDLEDYTQNAYHNSSIDRIAEQQLLATETTISLLIKLITGLQLIVW